jgi:DNA-binding MarR family transcriptional regulator
MASRIDDETLAAWRAFLNAHARITRRIGRDLAEAGLPDLSWYDVLWAIHRAPGRRLRVHRLADEVVLSPTGMTRMVDRLEAAGMVRREPVPGDRRGAAVAITPEGVALLRRMWPVYAAGIERHFAPHAGERERRAFEGMAESAKAS